MTADKAREITLISLSRILEEIDRKITKRARQGNSSLVYVNNTLDVDQREFLARHYSNLGFETDWTLNCRIFFVW